VSFKVKVGRAKLTSLSRGLAAANGDERIFAEMSAELSRFLVTPWIGSVGDARQLLFIPDSTLAEVPFSALRDTRTNGYLIDRFNVVNAPSLESHCVCRERRRLLAAPKGRSLNVLFVGVSAVVRQARLLSVGSELTRLAALYGSATILRETAATKEGLLDEGQRADVIHFAGHAVSDSMDPRYSSLLCAPSSASDGVLTAQEIVSASFHGVRVVVLDACDTAAARKPTYGAASIAEAFLAAGVPTVVGAVWAVPDGRATYLMEHFHRALRAGLDPIAALMAAKRESRRHRDLPAVWAGFEVLG
jgi:CHAT domain-containing protein